MKTAKWPTCFLAALLLTGFWVTSASGEIIYLKNGNRLVGKILREEGKEVVVKVSFGELRVAKEDIVRIEAEPTPSPTPTPTAKEPAEIEASAQSPPSPSATASASPTASPSPTAATMEPVAPAAKKFTVKPFDEWYAAWHPAVPEDVRGYVHNSLGIGGDGVISLRSEIVLLKADRKLRVQSTSKVVMGPDCVPLSFSVSQRERAFWQEVEGVVSAGYVSANLTVLGEEEEKQVAFPKGALAGDLPVVKFLQTARLSVGSRESYRSFDFLELAPVGVRIKVVGRESVRIGESSYQTLVLEVAVERGAALVERYKLWVQPRSGTHPSGRILKRQELPDGYTYVLSSEKEAREPVEHWLKTYEALLKWMDERRAAAESQEAAEEP